MVRMEEKRLEQEIERILNNPEKANIKPDFLFLFKQEKLKFAIDVLRELDKSMIMLIYNTFTPIYSGTLKDAEDRWYNTVWAKNIKLQIEGLETELDTW